MKTGSRYAKETEPGGSMHSNVGMYFKVDAKRLSNKENNLFEAIKDKRDFAVGKLLKKGVDPNIVAPGGSRPLTYAMEFGSLKTIELLLKKGADIEGRNMSDGARPLLLAAEGGRSEIVEFLIAKGAKIDAVAADGVTPLRGAAGLGKTEVVKILLDAGANIEAMAIDGLTPLYANFLEGNLLTTQVLLSAGANAGLMIQGRNSYHLAKPEMKSELDQYYSDPFSYVQNSQHNRNNEIRMKKALERLEAFREEVDVFIKGRQLIESLRAEVKEDNSWVARITEGRFGIKLSGKGR